MNITKQIASEVSEKLLQKQAQEIVTLKDSLKVHLESIILMSIPSEVIELYKKHPNYLETRQSFQLSGNGFNYKYLNTKNSIPSYKSSFQPTENESIVLHKMINKIESKENDYKKLFSELEIALFSLRTYKRVEENFPEAFLLLPKKNTTALAINISDLRNKIK